MDTTHKIQNTINTSPLTTTPIEQIVEIPQVQYEKPIIILENIRSCYNVGNIIRTADALGRDVILTGYTPSPRTQPKVKKTSLGAECMVGIDEYNETQTAVDTQVAIQTLRQKNYYIIAAEVTENAVDLGDVRHGSIDQQKMLGHGRAVVVGNEVVGVEPETLQHVDLVVKVPMVGEKESLNVGQTAAIFMWELR